MRELSVSLRSPVARLRAAGLRPTRAEGVKARCATVATGRRAGLVTACVLALALAAPGLTDEGNVSLHGDMPRFLMNGVFLLDMARDLPRAGVDSLFEYAERYYAQYPALSLGHHPPLLAVLEAPAFALFGVSVGSARVVMLVSLLVAVVSLFLIVDRVYGALPAFFAASLLATSPAIVQLSRSVMSEMPAAALVLVAALALQRFCATGRRTPLALAVFAAVLSLYAKQLAVFAFPAMVVGVAGALGVRRIFRLDLIVAAIAVVVLTLPLVALTLKLSPGNVSAAMSALETTPSMLVSLPQEVLTNVLRVQFHLAVLALAATGALWGLARRDGAAALAALWTVSVIALVMVVAPFEPWRYAIYAVPAVCMLAASMVHRAASMPARYAIAALLVVAVASQTQAAIPLVGARGYEEAAKYVVAHDPGATVLFSGAVDTGFFTFFVRKHDADRHLVVLRSDKLLTTSLMNRLAVENRIEDRREIYNALRTFGTRFVVIEDLPTDAPVLEWLREELRTPRFAERLRIRIATSDVRLSGADVVVFEFLEAGPPDPGAVLSLKLPLVGRAVEVPLATLIEGDK